MTTATQDKIDKRASVWEQMKALMDSAGGYAKLDGEGKVSYDRLEVEYDTLDSVISAEEKDTKHAQRDAAARQVDRSGIAPTGDGVENPRDAEYAEVFAEFVKNGMLDMDADARATLRGGFQAVDQKEIRAAGGVGTNTAGGYLVPAGFRELLIEKQKAYGAVAAVATIIETETGNPLPWATNDDTGNVGALLAENTAASEQDFVFGTAQLGAYKYTSKLFRESIEFLQDVTWFDLEGFLARKAGERLGRVHNQHYTTGTGTAQPLGIVTGATSGVTAAGAAAITSDEFIDLQHSVDPAYRNEKSKYMLSDTALKIARKLKAAGTGEYLFQASTAADTPSLIAGKGFVINQDMAVPATGVKSVLFGDFEAAYVIRRVKSIEFLRLAERYAEFGQVGFIAFDREDGTVQDANAYRALTQA